MRGFFDFAESKGQPRGHACERYLIDDVAGGNGGHLNDAATHSIEAVRCAKQRAGFVQLQFEATISALSQLISQSYKAIIVGTAGSRPVRLHPPSGDILLSHALRR